MQIKLKEDAENTVSIGSLRYGQTFRYTSSGPVNMKGYDDQYGRDVSIDLNDGEVIEITEPEDQVLIVNMIAVEE